MLLIVECKYKIQQQRGVVVSTYGEIGAVVMGRPGQWIVNLSLVVSQAGFAVACAFSLSSLHGLRVSHPSVLCLLQISSSSRPT
jgi:hypothetical protein